MTRGCAQGLRAPHALRDKRAMAAFPTSRRFVSQRLKLHYADWGNETAAPLIVLRCVEQ